MKDFKDIIKTGSQIDFANDVKKIFERSGLDKDLMLKYLALYYCSNNDGKVIDRDVFRLLLCNDEVIDNIPINNVSIVPRDIYLALTFKLKDKKFYKMAEQRGVV